MIGVDERTYQLMWKRTFAEALTRSRGDPREARQLAAYAMRDWFVIGDGEEKDIEDERRDGIAY